MKRTTRSKEDQANIEAIGLRIAKIKYERQLTQEEIATELNIQRQTLSCWMIGQTCPDAISIRKLAKLFGVSTDYLLLMEDQE